MSMIECINYFIYQPSKEHPWIKNFDVVFSGQNIDTDDRTKFWKCMMSDTTLIKKPKVVEIGCAYQSDNVLISMEGQEVHISAFAEKLSEFQNQKILVDITTFDVPDLTHLLDGLFKNLLKFTVCYIEPQKYCNSSNAFSKFPHLKGAYNYALSGNGAGMDYLQYFEPKKLGSKAYFVSLGYEAFRLAGFLNSDEVENEHDKYFIIGLPPFNIGWEKRSVDVNFTLLASMEKIEQRIHPIPSDDPIQNYEHIKKKIDPLDDDITILLFPMGSKPQTLGMIWFAINAKSKNQKDVAIVYNFMQKNQSSSTGVDKIHMWEFGLTN